MVLVKKDPSLTRISLSEICDACHVSTHYIEYLVEYEIIEPIEMENTWVFDVDQMERIKTVLRLQHDLDFNLAGAAIVLDLLEELRKLREKMRVYDKHPLVKQRYNE